MTDDRFQTLIDGPLRAKTSAKTRIRLAAALRFVMDVCGANGDLALEQFCSIYQTQMNLELGGVASDADTGTQTPATVQPGRK
jgi:hypothetical protein